MLEIITSIFKINKPKNKVINEDKDILNKEQQEIYELINTHSDNVYITGKAGSGKSFLLRYFVKNTNKSIIVVAPTGVAALNVEGQTIHSLFRLKPSIQFPKEEKEIQDKVKTILKRIDALVIDEISMVRADLFEMINKQMQLAHNNTLPFGGKQIIMFGDLYQIPPVVSDSQVSRYLEDTYKGVFFFNAPSYNNNFKYCELFNIYRQKDPLFINILNRIRIGNFTDKDLKLLNMRYTPMIEKKDIITLVTTNRRANEINTMKLKEITQQEYTYLAEIYGDLFQGDYPTEPTLRLKVGAQVMLLKNDNLNTEGKNAKKRWVNGTIATITYLSEDIIKVLINDVEHILEKASWSKYKYYYNPQEKKLSKKKVEEFIQYPLKLAWAITIHKSQGQTYKKGIIDLTGGTFTSGQVYVALSRCIDLNNLYLKRKIQRKDIIMSQPIIEFMEKKI